MNRALACRTFADNDVEGQRMWTGELTVVQAFKGSANLPQESVVVLWVARLISHQTSDVAFPIGQRRCSEAPRRDGDKTPLMQRVWHNPAALIARLWSAVRWLTPNELFDVRWLVSTVGTFNIDAVTLSDFSSINKSHHSDVTFDGRSLLPHSSHCADGCVAQW